MANPKLFRTIDKAVSDYQMIKDGDRILIGASGGKDSTALAEYFAARLKRRDAQFTVSAMHIATDIGSPFNQNLAELFERWGIPLIIKTVSVLGRLKERHRMNCWWCSSQRRTELNNFALKNGFNKIALGHHLDDILETLLMNALGKGILSTMPPVLQFEKYPITMIRPLCLADIPMIVRHAQMQNYFSSTCTCNYQSNSTRKEARSRLDALTGGSYELKLKLFTSLKNIRPQYLP
ncbi:tRNA 2-thiocytidine biosynthesis TtcA family protein [Treponema phagedenis]|uniref:tRNA 2-thiocytidine biosynthesis TtcA family protein n=1 Tax=Treponema phagedenis TaxID=162 RepID=UPI0004655B6A|nr:tRNA 2-thiocytidine biosynthesis TtcA family protein [Treponema phagedenis]QEJ95476.1 tRNA 2-thiocytidine biosynthesis protein TtcA [Treponema phagedenis]QEK01329.1 tRNA 2-thiocytidine biosynthesis protein TtcA [Treponema phagedenis]QEK06349.1 tRNA 2-thiocytidine biosynthesis protein TtcA [Treponema phagedenis]QSH95809.1 tRNA 2-thiocytidine biosynthesis protein TtcA [Treponema phagedenis]